MTFDEWFEIQPHPAMSEQEIAEMRRDYKYAWDAALKHARNGTARERSAFTRGIASWVRQEVKTYRVRSYHVGCGGEWLSQGATFGTRFLHRCDKCTALENFDQPFPAIHHE